MGRRDFCGLDENDLVYRKNGERMAQDSQGSDQPTPLD